ncbi:MAG: lipoxygenase family protein [Pseudomonadota bacterium]|nr:lipoxygenase family protein [Pseudomonadota bacterium]
MPHQAPANPSLPQNDTPAEQAARAAQLVATQGVYGWTTSVPSLPGAPLLNGAPPANEQPTLTWLILLADELLAIVKNHLAVKKLWAEQNLLPAAPAAIAAEIAALAAIELAIGAIKDKIAHYSSGGTIWSRIAEDIELALGAAGAVALDAALRDQLAHLFDVVSLTAAEHAALGSRTPRDLERYRELFQTLTLPGIGWTFQDDAEFARLRVAGPNAILIRQITTLPDNFALTAERYAAVVNGDDLATALAADRVFLCDYAALNKLVPGSYQGQAKYAYRPLALFAVPPGGASLVPVAIQCGQDGSVDPVFTPSVRPDEQWGWDIAKFIVQVADGNYHELVAHLAHTHLVIEALALATRRHLAEVHPLWALLVPHYEGTLFINNAAATSLITPGGPIDHIFAGTIASSQAQAVAARLAFDFTRRMLPHDLKERGVDDAGVLPDYPYRDDALLVWQAIHQWVSGYVGLYYAGDADVAGDPELAAWCAELQGEGQLKGFPTLTTVAGLIDACTMILFTCSAQHAAVNFPQKDVMEFAPAVTGAGWEAAPLERQGHDRSDWLDTMPPLAPALQQLETLYLLGSLHYRPLGTYQSRDFPYPAWFQDPRVTGPEGPLVRFQASLQAVETRIVARNAQRRVAYPYLLPSRIPTSTNI